MTYYFKLELTNIFFVFFSYCRILYKKYFRINEIIIFPKIFCRKNILLIKQLRCKKQRNINRKF